MGKLFFHIGAHKTGTTYLQKSFAKNRRRLNRQDWVFIYLRKDMPDIYRLLLQLREGVHLKPPDKRKYDKMFATVRAEEVNYLISCESALGGHDLIRNYGELYPKHPKILRMLREDMEGIDATIGLCIRDFGSYVESSYAQLLLEGAEYSAEDYATKARSLSWLPIVEQIVEIFGEDKLKIWTYEDFAINPAASFKAIATAASIDAEHLRPRKRPSNPKAPTDTLPILRMWNEALARRKPQLVAEDITLFRNRMRHLLSCIGPQVNGTPFLDEQTTTDLSRRYRTEVAEIRCRRPTAFLPLKEITEAESCDAPIIPFPVAPTP